MKNSICYRLQSDFVNPDRDKRRAYGFNSYNAFETGSFVIHTPAYTYTREDGKEFEIGESMVILRQGDINPIEIPYKHIQKILDLCEGRECMPNTVNEMLALKGFQVYNCDNLLETLILTGKLNMNDIDQAIQDTYKRWDLA